jgi:hypothetical protein
MNKNKVWAVFYDDGVLAWREARPMIYATRAMANFHKFEGCLVKQVTIKLS